MSRVPKPLRRAGRIAGFVGLTSAMLPAYLLRDALVRPRERDQVRDRWVGAWTGTLLRLFSIDVDLGGRVSDLKAPGGRLVVANHRSAIDVAILLRIFGGHMVSRADLSTWPLLGASARSVGTIFVDRTSTASGAGAIREMRRLLSEGQRVILFPEGTTFEGDVVRPFQGGAFIAALRTQAAIVPVGIAYPKDSGAAFVGETFTRHLSRMSGADPTRVSVRVGAPIPVQAGVHAAELATRSRAEVQRLVDDARKAASLASGQPPPTR
jgi:1-acyl-sn-glycerol-3-phosphate acyltransferase